MVGNIRASELRKRIETAKKINLAVHIVDVRTEFEYSQDHIPGSILIPHDEIADRANELNPMKDQELFVICRSGNRSMYAARILESMGFSMVFNVTGGYIEFDG